MKMFESSYKAVYFLSYRGTLLPNCIRQYKIPSFREHCKQ